MGSRLKIPRLRPAGVTGELEYGSMAKDRSLECDRSAHAPVNSRLRTEANPSHCMGGWWPWQTKELRDRTVLVRT